MTTTRRIAAIALIFSLGACTTYSLVEAKKGYEVSEAFKVDTPISWNKARVLSPNIELWTIDGMLQTLIFVTGVSHGETLFTGPEDKKPKFDEKSTIVEAKAFFVDSMLTSGALEYREISFAPANLAGQEGFRLEFKFTKDDGLERRGFVVCALKDKKFYAIMYSGADIYFFDKAKTEAEKIVSSAVFL